MRPYGCSGGTPYEKKNPKGYISHNMHEMMYVLSNEHRINGAAALLDKNMMHKITERLGDDLTLIPSSVHEIIIVKNAI